MDIAWIIIAFVAGASAQLIRMPTLLGYIAAGLILGGFGVAAGDFIVAAGDFGITMLLFTVGLHIRLKNITRPEVLSVGGIHLLSSLILFTIIGFIFGLDFFTAFLVGTALGFSSTVLTAKSLEARNELDAYHGRVAMGILIFQDVVAIGLIALTGTETPQPWAPAVLLIPLLRPVFYRLLDMATREEMILLFGLLMALGVGELFYLSGLSAKLGALLAGIVLAGHRHSDLLYEKLWALKEVFLVAFFLQVGLAGLPELGGLLLALLFLLLLPLKAGLFFFLMLRFKLRARTAFVAALSLTAYSEFALVVGAAAEDAGLLPTEWLTMLALIVAVSFAINAALGGLANTLWARYEHVLVRYEHDVEHPDHRPRSLGNSNFLVVGMGRVGSAAYDFLCEQDQRPLGLDADPAKIERQLEQGRRVLFGESQDPELWEELALDNIEGIILALPNLASKIRASHMLREKGYAGRISALVRSEGEFPELMDAGVNTMSMPLTETGRELARSTLGPGAGLG
jgi:predicted Kef-type K+ transport protein